MKFKKFCYLLAALFFLFNFNFVYSEDGSNVENQEQGGDNSPDTVNLVNPLGDNVEAETIIARVINSIFGIVGSLALLMFIYGGLIWMTSGGSQEKIKQGRGAIVWASIGLAVIFMSYMLVRFVITTIS